MKKLLLSCRAHLSLDCSQVVVTTQTTPQPLLTHQLKQLLLQQIPVTLELKLDSTKTEFTTVLLTLMLKLAGNISHS